jgi:hypothetical protein
MLLRRDGFIGREIMSIADRTGQGDNLTDDQRKLELFTNRFELILIFNSYLKEHPAQESILFFTS